MAFRSSAVTTAGNGQPSQAVTMPAGLTVGDDLYVFGTIDNAAPTWAPPTGWTLAAAAINLATPDGETFAVWRRNGGANGNEAAESTWTSLGPPARDNTFIAACWSGRDLVAGPRFVQPTSDGTGNSPNVSLAMAGGTVVDGDDVAWFVGLDSTGSGGDTGWSFTPPSGYTERVDQNNGWASATLATLDNASAGATGTLTGSANRAAGPTAGYGGWVIALPRSAAGVSVAWFRA